MSKKFRILFKKLHENAIKPKRITDGSAAYDAMLPQDYELKYGRQILPLGFAISMPPILYLDSRTRAGYAAKGIIAYDEDGNETRLDADVILGLIDSDYTNEVGAIVVVRDERVKNKKFTVRQGQAIAQLNFGFVPPTMFMETDILPSTNRTGGFGHMNGE